jgi:hypothetical protein
MATGKYIAPEDQNSSTIEKPHEATQNSGYSHVQEN